MNTLKNLKATAMIRRPKLEESSVSRRIGISIAKAGLVGGKRGASLKKLAFNPQNLISTFSSPQSRLLEVFTRSNQEMNTPMKL